MPKIIEEKIQEFLVRSTGLGIGAANQERMSDFIRKSLEQVATAQREADKAVFKKEMESISTDEIDGSYLPSDMSAYYKTDLDDAISKIV